MTKQELSQLYYLNREIEHLQLRLQELETVATGSTAEIADLKGILNSNIQKSYYELNRLNRYIQSVEDSQMRLILSLRYINELSWYQVAASIGGGNTDKSVQMAVNRFLNVK